MRAWLLGCSMLLASCGTQDGDTARQAQSSDEPAVGQAGASASASPSQAAAATGLDSLIVPRQAGKYAPRDECGSLPGARAFRERLLQAAQTGDAEAIGALAVEDVRLDFGGGNGRKALVQRLKADQGALMTKLERLLRLGCAGSDGGGLVAPWIFAQSLQDVDAYSAMLVTGADIAVLPRVEAGATPAKQVSWDVVSLVNGLQPDAAFQNVRLADSSRGYIATENLRSLLDYRLLAVRQGEEWKITALIAGD